MVAHTDATTPPRELLTFDVHAERIVDLRDAEALAALGVDLADAMAPWKPAVEVGEGRRRGRSAAAWRRPAHTG